MEKILTIGGSGLLGSKVMALASKHFETVGTYNLHPFEIPNCETIQLDIRKEKQTFDSINDVRPDCVILTSAMTNVDECELHPEMVWAINVDGTRNVAIAANKIGAKLIYISTDYVFDGKKKLYTEEDNPNPISEYGKTKLEGENVVKKLCEDYVIVRSSVLYGWNNVTPKLNFVTWIIDRLEKNKEVSLFTDQYVSPTFVDNLAKSLLIMFRKDVKGVYHASGSTCIDRFDIGKKIAEVFGLNEKLIKPISMCEVSLPAKRPMHSCLDVSKIQKELNIKMMRVDEGLREMKKQRCRK